VLPNINDWPDAVLYFLNKLEDKAMKLAPSQQRIREYIEINHRWIEFTAG
jgi:hypothetical protein